MMIVFDKRKANYGDIIRCFETSNIYLIVKNHPYYQGELPIVILDLETSEVEELFTDFESIDFEYEVVGSGDKSDIIIR